MKTKIEELFSVRKDGKRLKVNGVKIFSRADAEYYFDSAQEKYPLSDIEIYNEED